MTKREQIAKLKLDLIALEQRVLTLEAKLATWPYGQITIPVGKASPRTYVGDGTFGVAGPT